MVVVSSYVFDAVALQLMNVLMPGEETLCHLLIDIILVGLYVDDGSQVVLAEKVVMLGLAATDEDESLGHRQQTVHAWGIAVELVEQDMTAVHHLLVLRKGHVLSFQHFHLLRIIVP